MNATPLDVLVRGTGRTLDICFLAQGQAVETADNLHKLFPIDCNMELECLILAIISQLIPVQGISTSDYGNVTTQDMITYKEQTSTEAISPETTEELPDLGIQSPSKSYLGAGVAIGVSIMLVVDAILLALAFIYKEKLIVKITGKKEFSDTEMSRIPISSPVATTTRNQVQPQEAQTPASSNEYESLQRDNVDVHNTYEKMHIYQNL
ncbi:uncharacterized protein [Haliotis asinina]|uniref:uncharacterized protein n=1 Tax=Haliotis asinina TaxID=109174 RepID=UPI0035318B8D